MGLQATLVRPHPPQTHRTEAAQSRGGTAVGWDDTPPTAHVPGASGLPLPKEHDPPHPLHEPTPSEPTEQAYGSSGHPRPATLPPNSPH